MKLTKKQIVFLYAALERLRQGNYIREGTPGNNIASELQEDLKSLRRVLETDYDDQAFIELKIAHNIPVEKKRYRAIPPKDCPAGYNVTSLPAAVNETLSDAEITRFLATTHPNFITADNIGKYVRFLTARAKIKVPIFKGRLIK